MEFIHKDELIKTNRYELHTYLVKILNNFVDSNRVHIPINELLYTYPDLGNFSLYTNAFRKKNVFFQLDFYYAETY